MDENFVSQTLFWISGAIWTVAQLIFGFLLKYWFERNEKDKMEMKQDIKENKNIIENRLETMIKDFQSGVDSLKSAVHEMKELVSVVRVQHGEKIAEISRRLDDNKDWLEEHENKINEHSKDIIEIKSDCKHFHRKINE